MNNIYEKLHLLLFVDKKVSGIREKYHMGLISCFLLGIAGIVPAVLKEREALGTKTFLCHKLK